MWVPLLLVFCAALVAVQTATPTDVLHEEWEAYKLKYGKMYRDVVQEQFRKKVYTENKHKIARHNQKYLKGQSKFSMAVNEYADIMHHEFVATRNGLSRNYREQGRNGSTFLRMEGIQLPDEIDWVKKGYVTDVKNQGACGSCYSFSATGALEGQHMRKSGKLVSLSEQNIVDCSEDYGNQGCEGGLPDNCFQYIKENKGVDTEVSYPYKAEAGKCHFSSKDVGATDSGFVDVESEDEDALQEAVATVGPVSVGIDASPESFQFYHEGVYDEPDCSSEALSHAVLVVGYGKYEEDDYWLVKNSWGPGWGIEGYVRMSRNKDNQCGIATLASYPLV